MHFAHIGDGMTGCGKSVKWRRCTWDLNWVTCADCKNSPEFKRLDALDKSHATFPGAARE